MSGVIVARKSAGSGRYALGGGGGGGVGGGAGLVLGVSTAALSGLASFGGAAVSGGDVLARATYPGDATLDGAVDTADLGVLLSNFGMLYDPASDPLWSSGDVNYDASVDTGDLGPMLDHFGRLADDPGAGAVALDTLAETEPPLSGTLDGNATVGTGDEYTLTLTAGGPWAADAASWSIDWNDGTDPQAVPADASGTTVVTHAFAPGVATPAVTATVSGPGGTFDAGEPLAVDVTGVTAPQTPGAVTATAYSRSRIDLTWAEPDGNARLFRLDRSDDGGATWHTLATLAGDTTNFSDTGLLPSTTHRYRVSASNDAGGSTAGYPASPATTPSGLPEALTATPIFVGGNGASLAWGSAGGDVTNYEIEVRHDATEGADVGDNFRFLALADGDAAGFDIPGLEAGEQYTFRVRAIFDDAVASAYEAVVLALNGPAAPSLDVYTYPQGGEGDEGGARLTWSGGPPAADVRRYEIQTRGSDLPGPAWRDVSRHDSGEVVSFPNGSVRTFRVRAVLNDDSATPWGEPVPADQGLDAVSPAPTISLSAASGTAIDVTWSGARELTCADSAGTVRTIDLTGYGGGTHTTRVSGLRRGTKHWFAAAGAYLTHPGKVYQYAGAVATTPDAEDPAAPARVTATVHPDAAAPSIIVRWSDSADDETGYEVERSVDGEPFAEVAAPGPDATEFADTDIGERHRYEYRVTAVRGSGRGASALASITVPMLAKPTVTLGPASLKGHIAITWNGAPLKGWRVEKLGTDGLTWTKVADVAPSATRVYQFDARNISSSSVVSLQVVALGTTSESISTPTRLVTAGSGAGHSARQTALAILNVGEAAHADNLYYRHSNVNRVFDQLSTVLGKVDCSLNNGLKKPEYHDIKGYVELPSNASSDDVIHELVHALDDKNDWYITTWNTMNKAEALAYAVEYTLDRAKRMGRVDAATPQQTPQSIQFNWRTTWTEMDRLVGVPVFYSDLRYDLTKLSSAKSRPMTAADISDAFTKLGFNFSASALLPVYQDFLVVEKDRPASTIKNNFGLPAGLSTPFR